MQTKGLILGVQHVKGTSTKTGKPFDFMSVNFIDTDNPSGSPQAMSLPNDDTLTGLVQTFEGMRMKVAHFNLYQNGRYNNFGGFQK